MGDESQANAQGTAAQEEAEELKGQEPLPTADNEEDGATEARKREFVSLYSPKKFKRR